MGAGFVVKYPREARKAVIGPFTRRKLSSGEHRTIERLRREADSLGEPGTVAACERALAGWAEDADDCLLEALALQGHYS
jgi:hypothetical protein